MNFKERVLTALNHEEPDRVPFAVFILSKITSNKILGKKPMDIAVMLGNAELGSGAQGYYELDLARNHQQ
jgi:hypothetical protein